MEKYILKDGKRLRTGYTTGSCAAAAAKAAAFMLLTGRRKENVRIETPGGAQLQLEILNIKMESGCVSCAVKKDSGDDPDVTNGILIYAQVTRVETPGVTIDGGEGVGRVTKRGLDQPVGAAAINSVPRRMIRENVEEICRLTDYKGGLLVIISAPGGAQLSQKTFNPRLGIEGGISILGTTGIVEPMSEQALVDTIRIELRQKKANGAEYVLLTPGNYGSEYIKSMGIDAKTAVLVSNFIGDALDMCRELGFKGALLVGHIGKLVKIAGGMLNTHSKYGDCRMEIIAACAAAEGLPNARASEILDCATCDDAVRVLKEENVSVDTLARISGRIDNVMERRAGDMETGMIMFSRVYGKLAETKNAQGLLKRITEV